MSSMLLYQQCLKGTKSAQMLPALHKVPFAIAKLPDALILVDLTRDYSSSGHKENQFGTLWHRFASTIKTFASGTKALYSDVKEMYRIQSSVGQYSITGAAPQEREHGSTNFPLSWKQLKFVYTTRKDLVQMLPTVALFCIPIIGYVVPFIAFMYPQKLLSHHFWGDEQKRNIQLSKSKLSIITFQNLLQDIETCGNKELYVVLEKTKAMADSEGLKNCNFEEIAGPYTRKYFDAWHIPQWLPLSVRQRRLEKHMHYLFTCDWLLKLEKEINQLNNEQLVEACLERKIGIPTDTPDFLREQLHWWISVTTIFKECPVSLMSCLPVVPNISKSGS